MRIDLALLNFKNQNRISLKPLLNSRSVDMSYPMDSYEFNLKNSVAFRAACTETNFKIKDIKNLRCPVCNLTMLSDEQMNEYAIAVSSKRGANLAQALDTFGDSAYFTKDPKDNGTPIYRPLDMQIVEIIKELAHKNPHLSLSEIVQAKAKECIGELIVQQMDVVRELENYLKTCELSDLEKDGLDYVIQMYKNQILGKNEERFKRQCFIHDLKNRVDNSEIQQKIIEIISRLPNSTNSVDSFFVKWGLGQSSSKEIAYNLIYDSRATAEHIVPKSKGGKNDTNNYICDCAYCNTLRSNMDFEKWVKTIPDFEKNLQSYLETVSLYCDSDNLDISYLNYVENIIKTLERRSKGFLSLKLPENQQTSAQLQAAKKKEKALKHAKCINDSIFERMNALREKIERLELYPHSVEINYIESMKQKHSELEEKIDALHSQLATLQAKYDSIVRIKRKITQLQVSLGKSKKNHPCSGYQEKLAELSGLKVRLKELDEATLTSDIDRLKAKIDEYQDRLDALKLDIESADNSSRQAWISDRINKLHPIIEQSKRLTQQLSELSSQIDKEGKIRKRLALLQEQNADLEAQNEIIANNVDVTTLDNSDYKRYIHLQYLSDESESIKEQKRNRKNRALIEIVDIALDSIIDKMRELAQKDSVRYFVNLDMILTNKKEIDSINTELAKIEATKRKIDELNQELDRINGESTFEVNSYEYEALIEEKDFIAEVRDVPKLKKQYEDLSTTFKYNEKIIAQLENFQKLSDTKFYDLIKLVCSSEE